MKTLLLPVLLLAACSSPQVVTTPIPINVPVETPCRVQVVSKPIFATESLSKDATLFEQVRALLATEQQRKSYESQLEAAINACR